MVIKSKIPELHQDLYNLLSFIQADLVTAMMEAGWDPKLGDNTGLTPKDMADAASWQGRGDITELFKM